MSENIGIKNKKRTNPFVQIDKTMLSDPKISWKAKGILSYLLSKPDGWITYINDITKRSSDGRDSVSSGMRELVEAGYIEKKRIREKGKFKGWEYNCYEIPLSAENGFSDNGLSDNGNSDFGLSDIGESNTSNNDSSNNELSNKEDSNNDNKIPYVEIVNYLNDASSKNYRSTTNKTQNLIKARFQEGFTLDDFKKVIDVKTKQWLNDKKNDRYLRPETLFGTKFEGYLNEGGSDRRSPSKNDKVYSTIDAANERRKRMAGIYEEGLDW